LILRVTASLQGFRVNGDARIGNAAVAVDHRKARRRRRARAQTVRTRARLPGLRWGHFTGPIPIKLTQDRQRRETASRSRPTRPGQGR
jgi:hypothetical protein